MYAVACVYLNVENWVRRECTGRSVCSVVPSLYSGNLFFAINYSFTDYTRDEGREGETLLLNTFTHTTQLQIGASHVFDCDPVVSWFGSATKA